MANASSISVADFESLQQEVLRLKQENYDLQTEVRARGSLPENGRSWTMPRLSNIANTVSTVKNSLSSRDSQNLEVLTLQAQLQSLQEVYTKESAEREEAKRLQAGKTAPQNGVSEDDQDAPYLVKIQQQQSELDKLRETVEALEDTIRIQRMESDIKFKHRNSQKSLPTGSIHEDYIALQGRQHTLESRLSEAMSESKDAFTMRCTIQSMGKKLNDYAQLLNEHKEKAARVLTETNLRWESERLAMLSEDMRAQFTRRVMDAPTLASPSPLTSPSSCTTPTNRLTPSSTTPRPDSPIVVVDPRLFDHYRNIVAALQVEVADLKLEKKSVERKMDAKIGDLKTVLRKTIEKQKTRESATRGRDPTTGDNSIGPPTVSFSSTSLAEPNSDAAPWCATLTSAHDPANDALYLRKIHELDLLNEGLRHDLRQAQESEELLKLDIEHKRSLITHMMQHNTEIPTVKKNSMLGALFGSSVRGDVDLEKALEESIADNIRLRNDIRTLSDQLRRYM